MPDLVPLEAPENMVLEGHSVSYASASQIRSFQVYKDTFPCHPVCPVVTLTIPMAVMTAISSPSLSFIISSSVACVHCNQLKQFVFSIWLPLIGWVWLSPSTSCLGWEALHTGGLINECIQSAASTRHQVVPPNCLFSPLITQYPL